MTASSAPRSALHVPLRSRDAAAHLRAWVVSRYPGMRAQEHLSSSLSVPVYRPQFVPGKAYDGVMLPFIDQVVVEAKQRARQVTPLHLSTGTRPVLAAVRDLIVSRRGGR